MKKIVIILLLVISAGITYGQKVLGVKLGSSTLGDQKVVFIEDILINSPVLDAGMLIGDWIIQIGDQIVTNLSQYDVNKIIKTQLSSQKKLHIKVRRADRIVDLNITPIDADKIIKEWKVEGEIIQIDGVFISPAFNIDFTPPTVETNFHFEYQNTKKNQYIIHDTIDDNLSKNIKGRLLLISQSSTNLDLPFNIFRNGLYNNIFYDQQAGIELMHIEKYFTVKIALDIDPPLTEDTRIIYMLEDNAGNKSLFEKKISTYGFYKVEGKFGTPKQEKEANSREQVEIELYNTRIMVYKDSIRTNKNGSYRSVSPSQKLVLKLPDEYFLRLYPGYNMSLHDNGKFDMVKVLDGSYYKRFEIKINSLVTLHKSGYIKSFYPAKHFILNGIAFKKYAYTSFYDNGQLQSCELALDSDILGGYFLAGDQVFLSTNGNITGVLPGQGERRYGKMVFSGKSLYRDNFVRFHENGSLSSGVLLKPYFYKGLELGGEIFFHDNGKLKKALVMKSAKYHKYLLKENSTLQLYPNGQIQSMQTAEAYKYGKYTLNGSAYFAENGNVIWGNLDKPFDYKGIEIKGSFSFYENGVLNRASVNASSKRFPYSLKKDSNIEYYQNGQIKSMEVDQAFKQDNMLLGRYVNFYSNGQVQSATLYENKKYTDMSIQLSNNVSFSEKGALSYFYSDEAFTYKGFKIKKRSSVSLYDDGAMRSFTPAEDLEYSGLMIRGGYSMELYPGARVASFRAAQTFTNQGLVFYGGKSFSFYENGQVRNLYLYPKKDIELSYYDTTVSCTKDIYFYPNGNISGLTLAQDVELKGNKFKAGNRLSFDEDGKLK